MIPTCSTQCQSKLLLSDVPEYCDMQNKWFEHVTFAMNVGQSKCPLSTVCPPPLILGDFTVTARHAHTHFNLGTAPWAGRAHRCPHRGARGRRAGSVVYCACARNCVRARICMRVHQQRTAVHARVHIFVRSYSDLDCVGLRNGNGYHFAQLCDHVCRVWRCAAAPGCVEVPCSHR